MTDDQQPSTLGRRHLLRGGAVVAATTAGAVAVGLVGSSPASAAAGDPLLVGRGNTSEGPATTLTSADSATVPTLRLVNNSGPTLYLSPVAGDPVLPTGTIANTVDGPLVGVLDDGGAPITTYLATGADIAALAVPVPITPTRLLDTRTAAGRQNIVGQSAGAIGSDGRLQRNGYIDVAVDTAAGDFTLEAAFLNLTVTGGLDGGYVTAYPPGPRPTASTINFVRGQTIANGVFVGLGVVAGAFAVRLVAATATHVLVDLTGASVTLQPGPAQPAAFQTADARRTARTRPAARITRTLGRGRRRR